MNIYLAVIALCFFNVLADNAQTLRQQILNKHNEYRQQHCAPNLKLNDDINKIAQAYAQHLADTDTFEHSDNPTYKDQPLGENLWMMGGSGTAVDGTQVTDSWYNEIKDYTTPGFSDSTGHFTQVVWKDSEEIGAGCAYTSDKSKAYCVANYYPAGNWDGEYQTNVKLAC